MYTQSSADTDILNYHNFSVTHPSLTAEHYIYIHAILYIFVCDMIKAKCD